MSAYVPSRAHIDALVHLAVKGPKDRWPSFPGDRWSFVLGDQTPDQIGQILVDEAVKSVSYRYPNDGPGELPGPIDAYYLQPYTVSLWGARELGILEGLKAISGYEYQACEHPDWEASAAYHLCARLRSWLCSEIPGYDSTETWSID